MSRRILGVVAGLFVWMVVVNVLGLVLRVSWPGYASVAAAMAFTLGMMIARLAIGALATLVMGFVTAKIVRAPVLVWLLPGVLLLAIFVPVHVNLWHRFPIWYHLTFLLSLVPLTYAGGLMSAER